MSSGDTTNLSLFRRAVDGHDTTPGMPKYPVLHLVDHVAISGLWAGSFVGGTAGIVWSLVRKTPIRSVLPRATIIGGLAGLGGGAAMLWRKYESGALVDAKVDDRAFRLAHNKWVVRVDTYAAIGLAAGGGIGLLGSRLTKTPVVRSMFAEGFGGSALGMLIAQGQTAYEKYGGAAVAPKPVAVAALPKPKEAPKPAVAADKPKPAAAAAPAPAPAADKPKAEKPAAPAVAAPAKGAAPAAAPTAEKPAAPKADKPKEKEAKA
jgi:hypothetical protein